MTMNDIVGAVDRCITGVGEMADTELEAASVALERGLVHVLVEQHLRAGSVSRLSVVPEPSH